MICRHSRPNAEQVRYRKQSNVPFSRQTGRRQASGPDRKDSLIETAYNEKGAVARKGTHLQDKFLISPDFKSRFLRVALKGFWNDAITKQYEAELTPIYAKMGKDFDVLVDLREFDIQTADVVSEFARIGQDLRKMAIVTPSALLKRQAERATVAINSRVFADEASAIKWLAVENIAGSE